MKHIRPFLGNCAACVGIALDVCSALAWTLAEYLHDVNTTKRDLAEANDAK